MLIAVVLLIVALVAVLVPASPLGVTALGWFIGGMLVWAIDVLVGGYVSPAPALRRRV